MKKTQGRWSPTKQQISIAIDAAIARMPLDRAAELIGIGPRTLWIFTRRVGLPGIFKAWKDRPRYVPVSSGVAGSRTPKMLAPVHSDVVASPAVPGGAGS
jgi:hypothetical protein